MTQSPSVRLVTEAALATDLAGLSASYAARWKANTAYTAGQAVLNPTGDIVTAKANFTSGSSYNAANWNLSPSYAIRPTNSRLVDLTAPISIAHMGGANLAPEETLEAYRSANAYGADVLDGDVNLLLDGGLGMMHDSTLDRTTTGTGNLSDQSSMSFQQQSVDAASWFGGIFPNGLKPPLFSQLVGEFGNRKVIQVECKTAGACATALAAAVQRFGIVESVIISTSFWADIPTLAASGAHTQFVMSTGVEQSPAAIVAAGAKSVCVDYTSASFTTSLVDSMHAAGLKVFGYTPDRQSDVAVLMAKGTTPPDGWYSNDPIYAKGAYNSYVYRRTTDSFKSGTFNHGHLPDVGTKRGQFDLTRSAWGFVETANNGWVGRLVGDMCPLGGASGVPGTYSITFEVCFDAVVDDNRYAAIFFGQSDDRKLNGTGTTATGNNYYRALLSRAASLNMQLQKFTDNVAQSGQQVLTTTQVALGTNTWTPIKIDVTPTAVSMTRTDLGSGNKITLTDSAYRGGYFHLGVVGATAYFRNVVGV